MNFRKRHKGPSGAGKTTQVTERNWTDWRWQYRQLVTDKEGLRKYFPGLAERLPVGSGGLEDYPMAATPYYLSLATADDDDPILAQCFPSEAEFGAENTGDDDPLEEEEYSPLPRLVKRYPDRALIIVTDRCFVHCRHCNRRRLWARSIGNISPEEMERIVEYLKNHRNIREVILSGGDPLTLSNSTLEKIFSGLERLDSLEVIRLATRAPVVLPWRIDAGLASLLEGHAPIWVNTHFNHPREVMPEAAEACLRLLKAGAPVSNQTVLLKGVNDRAELIIDLCHALQRIGVRPYYLFQCDPVRGAGHFRTPLSTGLEIIARMRGHTAGLCVPTFVADTPGRGGKVPLSPPYLLSLDGRTARLRNYLGEETEYSGA